MTSTLWQTDPTLFRNAKGAAEQLRALLRYAVLAPSSHNSQPWQFELVGERLHVHADTGRWLRVADADQRELFISVGCALENLLIAAEYFWLHPVVCLFPDGEAADLVAEVTLSTEDRPPDARRQRLFGAITRRHTNHRAYDGRSLAVEDIAALIAQADDGIAVRLTADAQARKRIEELTARADAVQFADPAWRQELADWLAQGVFGTGWLTSKMAALAVSHLDMGASTAKKDTKLLRSASALGLLTVPDVSRTAQVRAGQCFERLFLVATERGIRLQPMNQVLQVPAVRAELEALLPQEWGVPQIAFRLGYADAEAHTPRRTLEDVVR
jgi:nitroreductase